MIRLLCSFVMALSTAGLTRAETPPMIQHTRIVSAAPAEVWSVWTTGDGFTRVFGEDRALRTEVRVGGPYEIFWSNDFPEGQRGSEGCTVLSFEPGRMLSFSWNAPPDFGPLREQHTHVVVRLDPLGPGATKMTLTHMGFGEGSEWERLREYFDKAWPWVLDEITGHFGGAPAAQGHLVLLNPARDNFWPDGPNSEEQAIIGQHFLRLQALEREGVLVFAGPSTDMIGPGVVILDTADEDAAREIMESDPAVSAGVFTAVLHPVNLSLLRERDRP